MSLLHCVGARFTIYSYLEAKEVLALQRLNKKSYDRDIPNVTKSHIFSNSSIFYALDNYHLYRIDMKSMDISRKPPYAVFHNMDHIDCGSFLAVLAKSSQSVIIAGSITEINNRTYKFNPKGYLFQSEYPFERKADLVKGRNLAAIVELRPNILFISGGSDGKRVLKCCEIYNVLEDVWVTFHASLNCFRIYHTMIVFDEGKYLYAFGGNKYLNIEMITFEGNPCNNWVPVHVELNESNISRAGYYKLGTDKALIFGGTHNLTYTNTTSCFMLDSKKQSVDVVNSMIPISVSFMRNCYGFFNGRYAIVGTDGILMMLNEKDLSWNIVMNFLYKN